jgi:deazaflavin-dependent oxidoreductase (nitroreductase family)
MSRGQPILLLISRGARTGQLRSTPLLYLQDGERLIVVASAGGRHHNPGWYYNLKANPDATVYLAGQERRYIAHESIGDERADLWRRAKRYNLGFEVYERWTHRQMPIIVLTPVV